jgi:hypothetical protein
MPCVNMTVYLSSNTPNFFFSVREREKNFNQKRVAPSKKSSFLLEVVPREKKPRNIRKNLKTEFPCLCQKIRESAGL